MIIKQMSTKEMMAHVSGVKIKTEKNKFGNLKYQGFTVNGEFYDGTDNNIDKFLLYACFLGYTASLTQEKDIVKVPVKAVWALVRHADELDKDIKEDPTASMSRTDRKLVGIFKRSFRLLGYLPNFCIEDKKLPKIDGFKKVCDATFDDKTHDCITFDRKGVPDHVFMILLKKTIHYPL